LEQKDKKVVLVVGMHRSGTSVLAAGLHALGVQFGQNLLPENEENVKGFFEDKRVVTLNDELLHSLGISWNNPYLLEYVAKKIDVPDNFYTRAGDILQDFKDFSFIGFKDPRFSLLLPFWQKVMAAYTGRRLYIIHALRHPLAVAASLRARGEKFSHLFYCGEIHHSLLLWTGYHAALMNNLPADGNLMVSFDDLLLRPLHQLSRIADFLGIDLPEQECRKYGERFLDRKLEHHRYAIGAVGHLYPEHCFIDDMYASLSELKNEVGFTVEKYRTALQPYINSANLFPLADYAGTALFQRADSANRFEYQISELQESIDVRDARLAELQESIDVRDARLAELQESIDVSDARLAEFQESIDVRDARLAELQESIDVRDARLAELQELVDVRDARLAEQDRLLMEFAEKISGLESEILSIVTSNSWRITRPWRWMRRIAGNPVEWLPIFVAELTKNIRQRNITYVNDAEWDNGDNESDHQLMMETRFWPSAKLLPSPPLVSVIIPCYNDGQYLWGAVQSAYCSYSGPMEVIVVNDGSSSATTLRILGDLSLFYPELLIIEQENKGLAAARNTGIRASHGEYIQFLDADDLLLPGKIDLQLAGIYACNGCNYGVILSNYAVCEEPENIFVTRHDTGIGHDLNLEKILFGWESEISIPIHTALLKKNIIHKNWFNEELQAKEDWIFWCNVFERTSALFIDIPAVIYKIHSDNMTRDKIRMGECWRQAVDILDQMYGAEFPEFRIKGMAWLEKYYGAERATGAVKIQGALTEPEDNERFIYDGWGREFARQVISVERPLISLVIPVYNHYEYLHSCFVSCLEQGYDSFEIIMIDDCSSDQNVEDLLEDIKSVGTVRVLRNTTNLGISKTQNLAVTEARGDFIAFLDCDDLLKPRALAEVAVAIADHPEADYFFSDRENIGRDGLFRHNSVYGEVASDRGIIQDLTDRMIASHLKVIRKKDYLRLGGCRQQFSGVQDWELALRFLAAGKQFYYIPKILYSHRVYNESATFVDATGNICKANIARRNYLVQKYPSKISAEEHAIVRQKNVELVREGKLITINSDKPARLDQTVRPQQTMKNQTRSMAACCQSVFSNKWTVFTDWQDDGKDTWFAPQQFHEVWAEGGRIIFDARGGYCAGREQFLRDFNSFIDFLLIDRLDVFTFLCGSLWSPAIVISPWSYPVARKRIL